MSVEPHDLHAIVAWKLPWVSVLEPVVGVLELLSRFDALFENAELVTYPVADRRELEGRERIHEAGCEAAKASVSEPRVAFGLEHVGEVVAPLGDELFGRAEEPEIDQAQAEAAPGEKFG